MGPELSNAALYPRLVDVCLLKSQAHTRKNKEYPDDFLLTALRRYTGVQSK